MFCPATLRRELFKIVDRRRSCRDTPADKLRSSWSNFSGSERVAEQFENERALAVHDVLVGRRLWSSRFAGARQERRRLLERQRLFKQLAAKGVELRAVERAFAKRECAVLRQTLRQPRVVKRFQPDGQTPPLIRRLTLEPFERDVAGFFKRAVRRRKAFLRTSKNRGSRRRSRRR